MQILIIVLQVPKMKTKSLRRKQEDSATVHNWEQNLHSMYRYMVPVYRYMVRLDGFLSAFKGNFVQIF